MTTHKVLFLPHNVEVDVPSGENLIRTAIAAGIHINASCGGEGFCGKCRVRIDKGQVQGGTSTILKRYDIEKNFRLACKSKVVQDVVVYVTNEYGDSSVIVGSSSIARQTAQIKQVDLNDFKEKGRFISVIEKICLKMRQPDHSDRVPDLDRILEYLQVNFNKGHFQIDLPIIRKIPDILRGSFFCTTVTLIKPGRSSGKTRILNIQAGDTSNQNFGIAMDIGTTTVYGQLLNLETGDILSEYGCINRQISYGEDIIARIVFAGKGNGLKELNNVLLESINEIISELIKQSEVSIDDISAIMVAGNTTMSQLFLKINPQYIRLSPYVPASTFYPPIKAVDLGISLNDHATALLYPVISSYVGGDIVAGVMASGMYMKKELTLFMDVGTNAEIVIGNRDWLLCTACSAGPAFEGGGTEFGIRAIQGAIEDFSIDPTSLEPMLITVGGVRPKGICGSGLISIVAVMFELGIINNVGKFNRELSTHRIRLRNEVYEYVLAWADETQINRDIAITEVDINNLIRTKGAIFSGCVSLLNEVGMTMGDVEQIILAGGFGSYVDLEKAITIGLLPEINPEKVTFIGNSSLMGAKMCLLTDRIRRDVEDVVTKMTSYELSESPSYMDNYVASLFLPHTDIDMFPKLNKRLKSMRKGNFI